MTREQAQRLLDPKMQEVLKAWIAGKEIEYYAGLIFGWTYFKEDSFNLMFDPAFKWRVKPEPRQPKRIWVCNGVMSVARKFIAAVALASFLTDGHHTRPAVALSFQRNLNPP